MSNFSVDLLSGDTSQQHGWQMLTQIVDSDPVPTLVLNVRHEVTHWNRAMEKTFGIPASEVVGTRDQWRAFYETARPVLADIVLDRASEAVLRELYEDRIQRSELISDAWEVEDYFAHLDKWFVFTATLLHDARGSVIGAIETLVDVTERKRVQEQLTEAQQQLVQAEKLASIGQLAAGVAHEINNPIGYVHSNLNALGRYIGDLFRALEMYEGIARQAEGQPGVQAALERVRKDLDLDFLKEDVPTLVRECQEGTGRVKKIVQDLKNFSRVDTHEEWQMADLHQGIDSTLSLAANELKYQVDVVKEYGDIPPVPCLPSQLNQVFLNLLVNAAQAMGEARGRITIRTGRKRERVWVEIEDNGCGISRELQQKIFDPFFTTKPVGKGTGLGLSLSYGIIQKHRGQIFVASEIGRGTIFSISLPLTQPIFQPRTESIQEPSDA